MVWARKSAKTIIGSSLGLILRYCKRQFHLITAEFRLSIPMRSLNLPPQNMGKLTYT